MSFLSAQPPIQQHPFQGNNTGEKNKTPVNSAIKTENMAKMQQDNSSTYGIQKGQRPFLGGQNQTGAQKYNNNFARTQNQNDPQHGSNFLGSKVSNSSGFGSNNASTPNVAVAARIEKGFALERKPGATGHQSRDQKLPTQGFIRAGNVNSVEGRTFLGAGNAGSASNNTRPVLGGATREDKHPQVAVKQELPRTSGSSRQGFVKYEPSDQPSKAASHASAFQSLNRTTIKSEPGCTSVSDTHQRLQSAPNTTGFAPASSVVKQEPNTNQFHTGSPAPCIKSEPAEFGRVAPRSDVGGSCLGDMSTGSSMDEDNMVMAKRRRFYSGQNPGEM